jgi:pyrroloquinoline quinone biosynthesis protein D
MDQTSKPRIAPGCRLHPNEPALLVPEGTLNLEGPARDVLALLDGQRSVAAVVEELLQKYPGAPQDVVTADVIDLLNRMEQRGVVRG